MTEAAPLPGGRLKPIAFWLLVLAVFAGLVAWTVTAIAEYRRKELENQCRLRLKQLGVYCDLYRSKYGGEAPSLKDLYRPELASAMDYFVCPVTGSHHIKDDSGEHGSWDAKAYMVGYEYRRPASGTKTVPWFAVAWDILAHPDGRRCVLYYSGTTEALDPGGFERAKAVR